jgi:hypothetical protein
MSDETDQFLPIWCGSENSDPTLTLEENQNAQLIIPSNTPRKRAEKKSSISDIESTCDVHQSESSHYDVASRIWDGRWHLVPHSKLPGWLQDNDFLVNWHRYKINAIRALSCNSGHRFRASVTASRPSSVGTRRRETFGPI